MNIGDALRRTARFFPERIGLIDKYEKYTSVTEYTWEDFNEKVNRVANGLVSLGLKKQDRVGIYSDTRSQFCIIYHALMKTGLVLVPLNTAYKGEELIYMINDAEPAVIFVDADRKENVTKIQNRLPSLKHIIGLGLDHGYGLDFDTILQKNSPKEPGVAVDEEDLAMLLYTSGTTGRPKAVMLTHRNWCYSGILLPGEWRILPHYRFLCCLAPFFAGGIIFQTIAAFRGFTLVMCDWNPEKIMRVLQEEKIDFTMFAPVMTSMIVNHPDVKKYDFSNIKGIITSAAPISAGLLRKAADVFGDVYTMTFGTSETAGGGCQLYPEDVALHGPKSERITSVGKAMSGMTVRVIDDEGNDILWGSEKNGEVVISGPTVGKGYWKKPEAEDFRDGLWHSGDLARVDENGFIYIVDRKKDMILSGGANVYPREIEDVLYTHPAVEQAAVIGVPNEMWGETIKAIISLRKGVHVTEEEIIGYCKEHLAEYKKPRVVEFREKLPMNPSGKILKRELRDEAWKGKERKV